MGDGKRQNKVVSARRAIWESNLKSLEKLVMLALLEHWSATTDTFPSCSRLASFTSLSERSVRTSLTGLERAGFVGVSRTNGRSNRYNLEPVFRLETKARGAAVPRQEMPGLTKAGDAVVKSEPRQQVPPTPARAAAPPRHELPPKRSIEEIQIRDHLSSGNQTTQLQAHYKETFKQRKGVEPSWGPKDYGRINKYFKELIEALGGDLSKAKQVVRTALLDEWNSRIKPHEIFTDRDKWLGEAPRKKNQLNVRHTAPQRGTASHVQAATAEEVFGGAE